MKVGLGTWLSLPPQSPVFLSASSSFCSLFHIKCVSIETFQSNDVAPYFHISWWECQATKILPSRALEASAFKKGFHNTNMSDCQTNKIRDLFKSCSGFSKREGWKFISRCCQSWFFAANLQIGPFQWFLSLMSSSPLSFMSSWS